MLGLARREHQQRVQLSVRVKLGVRIQGPQSLAHCVSFSRIHSILPKPGLLVKQQQQQQKKHYQHQQEQQSTSTSTASTSTSTASTTTTSTTARKTTSWLSNTQNLFSTFEASGAHDSRLLKSLFV